MRRLLPLLLLFAALPARAILVESDPGVTSMPAETSVAPLDDPGWDNVGRMGLNGVYLGYGWVITAAHVPVPQGLLIYLDGVGYPVIASTRKVIQHAPGTNADLAVMRIDPYPPQLPVLELPDASPALDTPVLMIGTGHDRGAWNSWSYQSWHGGWDWVTAVGVKRWASNLIGGSLEGSPEQVASTDFPSGSNVTRSLVVEFNPGGSSVQGLDTEGMAVLGDSGGGLFFKEGGVWKLGGIQWANTEHPNQPASTAIYGNDTVSADLAYYRDKIYAIVRPCQDGVDNDSDGLTDLADPDCLWEGDMSELPACSDGLDNDFDGLVDTSDPDCASASDLLEAPDQDGDLVEDEADSCLLTPNPDQLDTNLDGFGNACDADYDNDGVVGGPDFGILKQSFALMEGDPGYNPDCDSNGDGIVGGPDFSFWHQQFGNAPGPSGLSCAGTVPCP